MKTLIFIFLINYIAFGKVNAFSADEIKLWVFAEQNRDIKYTQFEVLNQIGFRKDLPTVFVVHGYQSGYAFIEDFQKAYKNDILKTMNLIGIDWSKGAGTLLYNVAVGRVPLVGNTVGEFIMSAINSNIIQRPDQVHVVGHSLGAHIAGFVGKYMAKKGRKLQHITALDPAGPLIGSYSCPNDRLCNTDANFVEAIHTNGGTLGMFEEIRPLDMYLNGGRSQPDCWLPTCSHSYSHEWYRQSIHVDPIRGWKCNDLKQMEKEKLCKVDGNPRNYRFEIIQKVTPPNLGVTYVPTGTSGPFGNTIASPKTYSATKADNLTLVVFGFNDYNVNELVSLLSDDGHLEVQLNADKVTLINPTNFAWRPDPKYVIYTEKRPEGIAEFLSRLQRPYRFVVPFDITDMFTDSFWMTLNYLAEDQTSARNDRYPNELKTIAMRLPHDRIPLKDHLKDLKARIQNGLQYSADFEMLGMHAIEKSGPVNSMPELVAEVAAIKGPVGLV